MDILKICCTQQIFSLMNTNKSYLSKSLIFLRALITNLRSDYRFGAHSRFGISQNGRRVLKTGLNSHLVFFGSSDYDYEVRFIDMVNHSRYMGLSRWTKRSEKRKMSELFYVLEKRCKLVSNFILEVFRGR